ncbi:L-saccharopine oxidase [Cyphellophora attinorum]|uniref:L-saccharopine oxidase n=1 Tax=Cyphellophora attinorum TaxID=1664694 RepID=A0A0N1GWY4_9EURO|nr:L-saccharopine oxidase [Phialophora attinorum]KPI34577.1 L-saccharopine oxidase [Phialophora attinorum]
MSDSDVLIVGAGIFGTSTAYHLSLTHPDPSRITVLDRAPVPSPQAASTDINKIVRADYGVLFFMQLAYEALEQWTSVPWLKEHFHQTGWVALDEKDSDLSTRIRSNFKISGQPDTSADISLDEVKKSWGGVLSGINTDGFDKAYTNSTAGWADASSSVDAMMQEAMNNGVQYMVGEVNGLEAADGRVSVKTTDGRTHTAKQIVLATGAWTPWLMAGLEASLSIPAEQSIDRQLQAAGVCVAAFRLTDAEAKHYSQMPVLIYGSQGEVMPPTKEMLFKFTNANTFYNSQQHPSGKTISVPSADQHSIPPGLKQESIDIIRSRIPEILQAYPEPHEWRLCWDAISPDQRQLICRHPDDRLSNLYFATAGSFHSWKFLPVIGKYVANVLNGVSNGQEKDAAWEWKTEFASRGAHEKVMPKGELRDR